MNYLLADIFANWIDMITTEQRKMEKILSLKIASITLQHLMAIFISLLLIYFAGFREIGFDPDSLNYASIIQSINFSNFRDWDSIHIEPSFYLISHIAHWLFGDAIRGTLIIYATLGITLKLIGICRLSSIPLLSVVSYMSYYYFLHEFTQIRVGVASAIFLLAIPDIVNRNLKAYIIKTIFASFFHYLAIIMLPLYLIINSKISKKVYFILPVIGISFAFINEFILDIIIKNIFLLNILPSFISYKIQFYVNQAQQGVNMGINIFNLYNLSLIIIYYFSLMNINRFKLEIDIIMIKILGFSLFIFPLFSFLPIFAYRISEFLQVVTIILLPSIVLLFRQKKIVIFIILIYLLFALYRMLFCVLKLEDFARFFAPFIT